MVERNFALRLSKGELRWPLAVAAALMALTCLAYFFGWFITPPDYQYSGYLSNPDEHNVYLAYMRQAQEGRWLFTDQFTTEPQEPWFFHSFFLFLGLFSRISRIPLIWTYHLARLLCGTLLLVVLYVFSAIFLQETRSRRFFLLFVSLSSGLGWAYCLILRPGANQPHPPDFGPGLMMPELITFLTLLLNPLFCFSVLLLVSTLLLFALAMERGSFRLAFFAGLAGLVLANVHSYDLIPLVLAVLLYLLMRAALQRRLPQRELLLAAIVGIMLLPALLYQFHLYLHLPVFRLKAEVATPSPPFRHYLLALGLPLLFALPGIWLALRRARAQPVFLLPIAWFAAALVSVYLPSGSFPFQRKMAEGMQIPVCLLAALFLSGLIGKSVGYRKRRFRGMIAALLLVACFPSNAFFLHRVFRDMQSLGAGYYAYLMPPLYLREEQVEALRWLDEHTTSADAVLCNSMLGSYIPSRTGAKTYVGHWAETLNYPQKLAILRGFLAGRLYLAERKDLLRKEKIKYLLVGAEEKALAGGDVSLADLPLQEAARLGEIVIYHVKE